jgi:myo-inositol 2-dehydrogenase/D-chiro-inositol 1-dehydrogenase
MPAYAIEWEAFVAAMLDGAPMPVTLEDGIAALAMAEAATVSAKIGEAVEVTY